jgi:hypothetical protein
LIEIEVEMTYEQYFECNRLFCSKTTTRFRRFSSFLRQYFYPVLGALFALLAITNWIHGGPSSVVIGNFLFSAFFWYRFVFAKRLLRKMYEKQAEGVRGTIRLSVNGIRFERRSGTANIDYLWKGVDSWMERPNMFMVIIGPVSFLRIPKDKLTPAEQDEVRGWLSENVKLIG